jgi:CO/xanthine dehydrogenase Mo-binding subunit
MAEVGSLMLGDNAVYDESLGGVVSQRTGKRVEFGDVVSECSARRVDLSATGWYVVPECYLDESTGQGKAYHVYSFATDIAEVEVDLKTGLVDVKSFIAVHDSGKIVNPLTATSQVEGGIAQGIGLALYERFTVADGHVASRDLSTYLIPTSLDICDDMRVEFIERLSSDGPYGAKGLGEPAIIPVAAAVANAVSNAVGERVESLPITPDWIIEIPLT